MAKITNINNVSEYPTSYDELLTADEQESVVFYFNDQQSTAKTYYEAHITDSDSKDQYLDLYNHQLDLLIGGKLALALLGIKMEYNWPNHESVWFLATQDDATAYLEWYEIECGTATTTATAGLDAWPTPLSDDIKSNSTEEEEETDDNLISYDEIQS